MADSDDADEPDVDPTEIPLNGDGPFQLPICTDLAEIALGESLAILRFETLEGQRVDLPVPIGMLVELKEAAEEALQAAVTSPDGSMVQ